MTVLHVGSKSISYSALPKINITTYFYTKKDVATFVSNLLARQNQKETLLSITVTQPEELEGCSVTTVTTVFLGGTLKTIMKKLDALLPT
jgi:hypothetical protein